MAARSMSTYNADAPLTWRSYGLREASAIDEHGRGSRARPMKAETAV